MQPTKSPEELLLHEQNVLSYFWQYIARYKWFGTMTAFNDHLYFEENQKRNEKLIEKIRELGLGYWKLIGHWIENPGTRNEHWIDHEILVITTPGQYDENIHKYTENITYTHKEWQRIFVNLMYLYKEPPQQNCLIKYAEHDIIKILGKSGGEDRLDNFHPEKINDYYSALRPCSKFVFDQLYRPTGWASAAGFSARRQRWL